MKKIIKNFLFILSAILVFSLSVSAEGYTTHKLPNGQTLVIYEIHNNPIVTIDTWIKTGSVNENKTNNGISHFLEHLFFKGTKAHPTGDADRILESKGAIVNAATSKDFTHYYITIPSEHFDTALNIHSDMLLNPQIPRKELEKERKVVLEEIAKDNNSPSKKVYDNLNDLLYTTHPYKRKVIGSAENIGTMRREEIIEYFNTYYSPSNMITVIVGDVDTGNTIEKVQNAFNQAYKKPVRNKFRKESKITSQRRSTEYSDSQSGYMLIGFRAPDIFSKEIFALDVLSEILGGGKSSRLYKNIKEQNGLAYSISSSYNSSRDDGIMYIQANFVPNNAEKLENAIFKEIEQIQKYGITEEELDRAKKIIVQNTYYSRESSSDIASELGYIITLTGNSALYNNYISSINKVTLKDVQNAAKKYLGKNKSAVSVILPQSYEKAAQETKTTHSFKKISENKGISKYTLDNNLTLIVNENKNNDIIAMYITAKGGEFIEKIPGEGTLAASTILKGTKNYSSQELASILDENGIKISASCDSDFFMVEVITTTAQIDKTLDLLKEIFNNAQFDEYELEKQRSEILSKIRQKRDIPMNVAIENYKTAIFENSVYSHTNKVLEKTLPSITRKDVTDYYKKITDSQNIIISVNGNVNSEKLANSFGDIFTKSSNPAFSFSKYNVTKLKSQKTISKNIKNLETSWLFVGWQAAPVTDKKDFVTLKVINTLLGSGLSSRLYRNLREADGLAYQLGTNYSPMMLSGTFTGYIGTNPATLEYARKQLVNEIFRLKTEFVSDTELKDAKNRLKGSFILAMETNSEKASNIGVFEACGLGYDFLDKYIKMIDEVTASDIVRVANKYFTPIYVQSDVR